MTRRKCRENGGMEVVRGRCLTHGLSEEVGKGGRDYWVVLAY